ncbi:sodium:calcium antiporter [Candidatus Actinomarina sp.]|jgi:cation:H+ antiporter|nr:sodium:calcium antiporter [Acidimicrobiia bacterium]MDA7721260.1 sodium:calcium antiporter [Acidimicrobiaceae bacterium]MDA8552549.1 sodium:calcium antiporter [bacterium]MDA8667978.1 sodium:calcium antiporter [Candidatus Actinomarina sp.]MDA7547500.1 sodium:calcium antiporter [Acidimicrobiia bacterium]|tara:strand:+ start:742 stop:1665 length:924 start_codon:yes stop_codon:yes gene_type:complete
MDILIILLGLAVGFILLVKGADVMVKSAVQIAVKLNIPQSIIGATFIGFGTSAPELFASTGAALNGNLSLGIGNIIGSNIANSLLVVAVLYLFIDKSYNKKIKLNPTSSFWMMIVTTVFVSSYMLINEFPLVLGVTLLVLVCAITYKLVNEEAIDEEEYLDEVITNVWPKALLSLIATVYGSSLVVDNAIQLAELFGISSIVIGVTVVALGTSLPEVAGTISAARLKKPDLVFGNIFGSNLFNIGLVGGASIIIQPGNIESDVTIQMFMMYFISLVVIIISRSTIKRSPLVGYSMLAAYSLFIVSLF